MSEIASCYNDANEKISVNVVDRGPWAGSHLLVIHDNEDTGTKAPHLFDNRTADFLLAAIAKLFPEKQLTWISTGVPNDN